MIKKTAALMFLYMVVSVSLGALYYGKSVAVGLFMGGMAMLVSFLGLWLFWHLVFTKKSIALASLVIIFKYVVLGLMLWIFSSVKGLSSMGFLVGFGSLLFAIFGAAILEFFTKAKK